MTRPLVIAHRGASALAPENSIGALEAAIASGADMVEADVRLARDGVPVICHDPDLMRLAGRPEKVDALDVAALTTLGMTPLSDMIAAAHGRIPLLLDCKGNGAAFWQALLAAKPGNETIFGVRTAEDARHLRALRPGAQILGFTPSCDSEQSFLAAGATSLRLWEADVAETPRLHAAGISVYVTLGRAGDGSAGEADHHTLAWILGFRPDAILVNDSRPALELLRAEGTLLP
ncbi:MAG: glycerophosphodiester phosphodiesterase [Beijerinckiaceae bacterium]